MTHIDPFSIPGNFFDRIRNQWMLVTAGKEGDLNTLTANWGGIGVLWRKQVATIYIRHSRHTFGYLENNDEFTLSFLPESQRAALDYCGKYSGRDVDKVKETGLTPVFTESGAPYFAEAELVLVCRKLYRQDIDPALLLDPALAETFYTGVAAQRMYIGEVTDVLTK